MHKALGRGLDTLLKTTGSTASVAPQDLIKKLPVNKIHPNRYQARVQFSQDSLESLAESLKRFGFAQPLMVSASSTPGQYELIAGERRLRAAIIAGLTEVPCMVRSVGEIERYELSLIENIQREDLNVIEEAEALRRLMGEFSVTQEELAQALGRSRSAIANKLRLLDLPPELRNSVLENRLSEGHARALLGISEATRQVEMGQRIEQQKLTVREVEKIVADWQSIKRQGRLRGKRKVNPNLQTLATDLQRTFSRRVEIQQINSKKGWVRLAFYSSDDFQVLINQLKGSKNGQGR